MANRHVDSINGLVLGEWLRSKLMLSAYALVRHSGSQEPTEGNLDPEQNLLGDFAEWRFAADPGENMNPITFKSALKMACASVDILFMADAVVRRTAADPEDVHVSGFGELVADFEMWRLLASDPEPLPTVRNGRFCAIKQRDEMSAWMSGFRHGLSVNPDYEHPGSDGAASLADGEAITAAIQSFDRFAASVVARGSVNNCFIPKTVKKAILLVAGKMRQVAEPGDSRDQCDKRLLHVEMPLLIAALERHLR